MGCVCMTAEAVDAVTEAVVDGEECEARLRAQTAKLDAARARAGVSPAPTLTSSGWLGGGVLVGFSLGIAVAAYWQAK